MVTIVKLSQEVVNRIAAGEVVQRPSSALKELLENSIDAGATQINVVCRDGGMELLQITDNGCGINATDLPLLCERFATSKLREFSDLQAISTFGFRGEALASISHVARVTVITKTEAAQHAVSAKYLDGRLVEGPTVCAGTVGTILRVEDLFYNSSIRKSAMSKTASEHAKIVDVVSKYALAFPSVAFTCKKASASSFDCNFPKASTLPHNIKLLYGTTVASKVHPFDFRCREGKFEFRGVASDVSYVSKKTTHIFFVNNRLVDSSTLRQAIEQAYMPVLVGGSKPFVALFLTVLPERVDVNVHPTKHEVFLLDEDVIAAAVHDAITTVIKNFSGALGKKPGEAAAAGNSSTPTGSLKRSADVETLNLKPISHGVYFSQHSGGGASSISSSALARGNVLIAPSTVVRVDQQRGDLMKFLKPRGNDSVQGRQFSSAVPSDVKQSPCTPDEERHAESKTSTATQKVSELHHSCDQQAPLTANDVKHKEGMVGDDDDDEVTILGTSHNPSFLTEASRTTLTQIPAEDDVEAAPSSTPVSLSVLLREEKVRDCAVSQSAPLAVAAAAESSDGEDDVMLDFKRSRRDKTQSDAVAAPVAVHSDVSEAVVAMKATICPSSTVRETVTATPPCSMPVDAAQEAPAQLERCVSTDMLLDSVKEICEQIIADSSAAVQSIFGNLVFVGVVTPHVLALQSGTSLLLGDTCKLARMTVYQRIFFSWGQQKVMQLERPLPIREALEEALAALEDDEVVKVNGIGTISSAALARLMQWREMYALYFGIKIGDDAELQEMPLPLGERWMLDTGRLPEFLLRLASDVPYGDEKSCFEAVARELSHLYDLPGVPFFSHGAIAVPPGSESTKNSQSPLSAGRRTTPHAAVSMTPLRAPPSRSQAHERQPRHALGSTQPFEALDEPSEALVNAFRFALVPALGNRSNFFPAASCVSDGCLRSVVTVEELYKVFERC